MSEDRFVRLENKIDAVKDEIQINNQHMAVYNEQLKIHIKGTEDNRQEIKEVKVSIVPLQSRLELENTIVKIIMSASALIVAILEIRYYLGK